jgi:hypothetical protein
LINSNQRRRLEADDEAALVENAVLFGLAVPEERPILAEKEGSHTS